MSHPSYSFRLVVLGAMLSASAASAQFVETVTPIHTLDGAVAGDGWGTVRVLGDVDGDLVPDFGVGVAANEDNGTNAGKAWIFSGATGDTIRTHTRNPGSHFGFTLCGVGDVDGDDRADYVITAPRTVTFLSFNSPGFGRAFLFSGATGAQLYAWNGEFLGAGSQEGFGAWCSGLGNTMQGGAGDVNGDGVPDIMLSAIIFNGGGAVFSGRTWIFSGANPGEIIYAINGENTADLYGWGGGGLGDIDGDGVNDFAVGAPDAGPTHQGRAYIYSGQTGTEFPWSPLEPSATGVRFGFLAAFSPGDVNNDAVPDILVTDFNDSTLGVNTGKIYMHSGVDGSLLYTRGGNAAGDAFGFTFGCGDVNFDGLADFAVGAPGDSQGAPGAGKVYIYSGDGSLLREMTATTEADGFGTSVNPAFDMNGDLALDFLVASPGHDTGGVGAGRVYVIAGDIFPAVDAPVPAPHSEGFAILGTRPNPTSERSEILFRVPVSAQVRLTVHDVSGRTVARLEDAVFNAGLHSTVWNGRDLEGMPVATGVYYARLISGEFEEASRIVLTR